MKKLTLLFLLLSAFGYSQQPGSLIRPSSINGYTVNGKVLMTATDGAITGVPTWTNSIPFSMITGTSSILFSTSTYSNPSWISSLAWSKITGTPTTLSGYGITDGVLNTSSITINGSSQLLSGSSFSVGNLSGSPTANYILKGVSSSSVTNSRILDNGTSIGINQTPIDAAQLEITGGALQGAYIQTSGSIGVNIVDNTGIANKSETSTGIGFRANVTNTSGVGLDIEYTPTSEKWIVVDNNGTSTKALNLPNQTASRVAVFDGSKYVTSSSVTTTELGLLSGVTGSLVTTTGTQTLTNKTISTTTLTGITTQSTTNYNGVVNQYSATAASSSTVDLNSVNGNFIHITGTATINNFGIAQAGAERTLVFDGALTLTYNATTLILPGAASIVTASGDVAIFRSEGNGWRCVSYSKSDESYTSYVPTLTGCSTDPTLSSARYKMLTRNTCHVIISYSAVGTSNATTKTITLPFNASATSIQHITLTGLNNGVGTLMAARTRTSSNVADIFVTFSSGHTASGSWTCNFNFVYQID